MTTPDSVSFDYNSSDLFAYFVNESLFRNNDSDDGKSNGSDFYRYDTPALVVVIIFLSLIIVATIIGNVFVIAAIVLEKSLQVVTNYLILSLAVTDLMVSVLVMPLSVLNEVNTRWTLSSHVCEMWISFDVLCCTASILHLVAISLDRFWAVSNIDYIRNRNAKKLLSMVVVVWIVSISISIPPLFGWRDPSNNADNSGECLISQDQGYTIFSTFGAFYCPLLLMLFLNYKIFKVARSRIRKKAFGGRNQYQKQQTTDPKGVPETRVINADGTQTRRATNSSGSDADSGVDNYSSVNGDGSCYNMDDVSCAGSIYDPQDDSDELPSRMDDVRPEDGAPRPEDGAPRPEESAPRAEDGLLRQGDSALGLFSNSTIRTSSSTLSPPTLGIPGRKRSVTRSPISPRKQIASLLKQAGSSTPQRSRKNKQNNRQKRLKKLEKEKQKKDKMEMRRERKAARVLLIITGAFVFCWLPFFLFAVIMPFCGKMCNPPYAVGSFFLWLGYFNSLVNPVIYTIFNPSFRTAFKKILYGKYRRANFKLPR